jgi:hypothetical protein
MTSPRFSHLLSGLEFIFNHFILSSISLLLRPLISAFRNPKIGSIYSHLRSSVNICNRKCFSRCVDHAFKSTKKLNLDILGLLDKFTILSDYGLRNWKSKFWAGCGLRALHLSFRENVYLIYQYKFFNSTTSSRMYMPIFLLRLILHH